MNIMHGTKAFFIILLMWLCAACGEIPTAKTRAVKPDTPSAISVCQQQGLMEASVSRTDISDVNAQLRLAKTYLRLGYFNRAEHVLQALEQMKTGGHRAVVQAELGRLYTLCGQRKEAANYLRKSIHFAQTTGLADIAALALLYRGDLAYIQGDYAEAQTAFTQSIRHARQSGKTLLTVRGIIALARMELDEGGQAMRGFASLSALLKSLPDDTPGKAQILVEAGRMLMNARHKLTDKQRASIPPFLEKAVSIAEITGEKTILSQALGSLGHFYYEQTALEQKANEQEQHYAKALAYTRRAVFAAHENVDRLWAFRWTWQQGRILRARNETDAAIQSYEHAAAILKPSVRAGMSEIYRNYGRETFYGKVSPLYFQWADLLLRRAAGGGTDKKKVQADLLAARDVIEQLKTAELKDYFRNECVNEFQRASRTLEEIDANTAVIYPILLDDRLELLVSLRKNTIQRFGVAVNNKKIVAAVNEFHNGLQNKDSHDYKQYAKRLYKWLIKPLRTFLADNNIKTLVFVPEGALRTIPMAALHDGEEFLIEQYAVAITPGLSLTASDAGKLRSDRGSGLLGGLTEVSSTHEDLWLPLNYAEVEVEHVAELYPRKQVLLGKRFTKENLIKEAKGGGYAFIHISTHAQLKPDYTESFILTYDAGLTLDELEKLFKSVEFKKNPIELLTFNACKTAVGNDERAALGLSGITVKSGALAVLATLWSVDDAAAYHVVSRFYTHLKQKESMNKARALQEAQKALLNSRYGHPYYWAPFLMIGNWL